MVWPLGEYVVRRGSDQPARALQTLHALTQRHTAEWALRPFIEQPPEADLRHAARLVRRPQRACAPPGQRRQPTAPALGPAAEGLVRDPSPTLPLLRRLQDDPSAYVRRSVANHLNDIAKDHPQLIVQWLAEHLPDAPPQRRALLKHACRTLIKQGHPQVLKAWGLAAPLRGQATLSLTPKTLAVGESLTMTVQLHSAAPAHRRCSSTMRCTMSRPTASARPRSSRAGRCNWRAPAASR